jgi:hypothetical protein
LLGRESGRIIGGRRVRRAGGAVDLLNLDAQKRVIEAIDITPKEHQAMIHVEQQQKAA